MLEIVRIKNDQFFKRGKKSNAIILYKSKKPESINKKILTNDQKRFIYSQFRWVR